MFHHRSLLGGPLYVLEGPGSVVALLFLASVSLQRDVQVWYSFCVRSGHVVLARGRVCVISVLFKSLVGCCTCDVQTFRGLHKLGKPGEATCQVFVTLRMDSRSGVEIFGPLKWRYGWCVWREGVAATFRPKGPLRDLQIQGMFFIQFFKNMYFFDVFAFV